MTIEERIKAAFDECVANPTAENLAAYENLVKVSQISEAQKQVPQDKVKTPVAEKSVRSYGANWSESAKAWGNKFVEAVTIGSVYTSLVPGEVASRVEELTGKFGRIRRLCTTHKCTGTYTFAVEGDGVTVYYRAEGAQATESDPTLNPVTLGAYNLTALVKVSKEMIADPGVDVLEYLSNAIAKGYAKMEDHEILFGAGVDADTNRYNMTGIITTLAAQASTPQIITSTAAAGAFSWKSVKDVISKIGENRDNAVILLSQAAADHIHELKDGSQYIFPQNQPLDSILGIKVLITSQLSGLVNNGYVMVVGDFSKYHIADRQGLETQILNEAFAVNGLVGVMADKRVDGKVSQPGAFAALKLSF